MIGGYVLQHNRLLQLDVNVDTYKSILFNKIIIIKDLKNKQTRGYTLHQRVISMSQSF
jgi:hypothetical protein